MSGTRALRWFKSSYSDDGGGNCVEIATCPDTVHIRDSKNPGGGIVTVSDAAWCTFLASPHPSPEKV
ncbi:DUF397 domain-containing protein [Streptomyces sp. NBC_00988]|uniref:DUF397 domain-containing protein n=1 Tax=Streptomyces sp. NBC_00988 TaxID=2903704 RepID=UPI003869AC77|nr:DUF397 domain-containing protein [Streptomyces sp. NBC_00988]